MSETLDTPGVLQIWDDVKADLDKLHSNWSNCSNQGNVALNFNGDPTINISGSDIKQLTMPTYANTATSYEVLTPEEMKEFAKLEEQHTANTKLLKLEKFKELPATLRQHVVNSILWQRAVEAINTIEAEPVNERHKELTAKNPWNIKMTSIAQMLQTINRTNGNSLDPMQADIRLPDGITGEDLINAHNEATLEESLLEKEDDSVQADAKATS